MRLVWVTFFVFLLTEGHSLPSSPPTMGVNPHAPTTTDGPSSAASDQRKLDDPLPRIPSPSELVKSSIQTLLPPYGSPTTNPGNPPANKEESPKLMAKILNLRHSSPDSLSASQPRTAFLSTRLVSSGEDAPSRYLLCLLGKVDAGIITRQRHLVACAQLASQLDRILIPPPFLLNSDIQPRSIDSLINVTSLARSFPGLRSHPSKYVKAWPNSTVRVDVHSSAADSLKMPRSDLPTYITNFLTRSLSFQSTNVRMHHPKTTLSSIGTSAKSQQTLVVIFVPGSH